MCVHVFLISSLIGDQLGCLLLESSHVFVSFSWLFRSSGSCWSLWSTWGLFLCRWKAKDPVSFFYIWWSVSQISFVKDAVFFPVCVFNIFVKAQGSAITWAQLHPFYCSIIYMSVLVPVPGCFYLHWLCSITWSQYGNASSIIHFFQDYFIYSCVFNINFKILFWKEWHGDFNQDFIESIICFG